MTLTNKIAVTLNVNINKNVSIFVNRNINVKIVSCLLDKCLVNLQLNFKTLIMSSARNVRIAREIKNFETKAPWGITCSPEKEDVNDVLLVNMLGPKGSPYEKGLFKLVINIPKRYPFEPPLVKFVTPVYHPNIDKEGRICMDMLKMPPKGAWLPTITLETLLVSLQTLLANPNPDDPLMMDVANEYKVDIERFQENARRYTDKYATGVQAKKIVE